MGIAGLVGVESPGWLLLSGRVRQGSRSGLYFGNAGAEVVVEAVVQIGAVAHGSEDALGLNRNARDKVTWRDGTIWIWMLQSSSYGCLLWALDECSCCRESACDRQGVARALATLITESLAREAEAFGLSVSGFFGCFFFCFSKEGRLIRSDLNKANRFCRDGREGKTRKQILG